MARDNDSGSPASVRIDKWLWAARFFKTRSLATEAVNGGKVELNGLRPKPSKDVKAGDQIRIRVGPFVHALTVRALSERRGPAAAAALLFTESPESIAERERLREQHRLAPTAQYEDGGRPTKKDRRAMSEFEDGSAGAIADAPYSLGLAIDPARMPRYSRLMRWPPS
jgi:ribosome-associated heat shock protein Hsp15